MDKMVLPRTQKIFYGVGHILNDLCANCWFSYVLIYMTKLAGLSERNAGLVLLIGQVADALFTLIIGYSCDKTKITWYGKRKLWHGIGTTCVLISFPFVFNLCIGCSNSSATVKLVYYSAFVIVFQFGWAATQIAHLSLIPDITSKESQRVELNAIRSGLTFVCGIFVYGTTWLLLGTTDGENVDSSVSKQFMILAFIVVSTGFVFSLIFHIGTKERRHKMDEIEKETVTKFVTFVPIGKCGLKRFSTKSFNQETVSSVKSSSSNDVDKTIAINNGKGKTWKDWLKDIRLYKTALMYMSTRLAINVFQSYFALYLTDALHFKKEAIAYFPLIVLIAGSFTSFFVKFVTKKIGSQLTYVLGALMIVGSSFWLFSVAKEHKKAVYGAAWLAGSGSSIILVTSLAKTAELVGTDKRSSAFVYSAMSFTDKLSTGIVIFVIQTLKPSVSAG
ncbi:major facilitator superfamily domain-containing protein 12-like [Hydractinia symbiolongicarpus]|uniref:major facilitator superfamily domain-containing protein 12-like n=1 Tax=Hydractinia symbiolongicarpus TaxID=13093 RepID=UPI00254FDAAF|nr:major facilitator superfamily domain-containing protein 12-like [Hydractinia symbiolongicarpus]